MGHTKKKNIKKNRYKSDPATPFEIAKQLFTVDLEIHFLSKGSFINDVTKIWMIFDTLFSYRHAFWL